MQELPHFVVTLSESIRGHKISDLCQESIRGHKISDLCHESSTTTKIASVHEILIHWIDEIPSVQQSSHYGNISYRTWHEWIGISRSVHAFFLFFVIWRSRLCYLDAETKAKEEYSQKLQELQAEIRCRGGDDERNVKF
ncbi:hypothetical protein SLEP1_g24571 [Rubroshorea leprosula]|uniref:Serine/threonine-protein phosphatase 2A activator n=1 Tax=Rubroshorea leprosula TaxID=152421 RepID=A0AAV5JMC9_9ROSI|nr:hypothetical protein SLEP1_g24571 [Rubroshorea leprosula]